MYQLRRKNKIMITKKSPIFYPQNSYYKYHRNRKFYHKIENFSKAMHNKTQFFNIATKYQKKYLLEKKRGESNH